MAFEETFSPLDRDEGNEEKADIVVQAFEPRGGQPTAGTDPRLVIHGHSSGLDSADKKEEGASPPRRSISLRRAGSFNQPYYNICWLSYLL